MWETTMKDLDNLRVELIDCIDDKRFDGGGPTLNYKEIEYLVDNYLFPKFKRLLEATCLGLLPTKIDMKIAIRTHSDAGAGHTIGYNQAIEDMRSKLKNIIGGK